jgi:diguanylate cyclase (GGDEF)-like protein/PAS domain S-box-containing protein
MAAFKRWLAAPVFEGDEEKTRRAALVNSILLGTGLFLCLLIAGVLLGSNTPKNIVLIDAVMLVLVVLLRRALFAGKVDGAALGLSMVGFIGITAVNIRLGTIRTPTTAIYLFYVLMVGSVFRFRGVVLATAASSSAILGLILAENFELLPRPDFSVGLTQWVTFTCLFGMAASLTYHNSRVTQKALERAQEENRQRKRGQEALRISEERHRVLAENARDVIWTMAPDGSITYISPSVEAVRGFTPEEAKAQTLAQIQTPASQAITLAYFTQLHADLAAGRTLQNFRGELEYYCKDGSTVWTEVMAHPVLTEDGAELEILGVTRDIAEHKRLVHDLQEARDATEVANQALQRANAELARMATTDALTGVANRRHFEQLAEAARAQAKRYGGPLSLLMFDIDHFKSINDRFGHLTGDQVLVELTGLVARAVRDTDVLARWGGEEFVVIMPHCAAADAMQLAHKLRALVAGHVFADLGTVTVSLGVAEFKPDESLDDWFDRADSAVYEAKAAGRNTVRLGA